MKRIVLTYLWLFSLLLVLDAGAQAVTVHVGEEVIITEMNYHDTDTWSNDAPIEIEAWSEGNTAHVSMSAMDGGHGNAHAYVGADPLVDDPWDWGSEPVEVTLHFAYRIGAEWIEQNGSANAFISILPFGLPTYDFIGFETGETGSRGNSVVATYITSISELSNRIHFHAYSQAHVQPIPYGSGTHSSFAEITVNRITIRPLQDPRRPVASFSYSPVHPAIDEEIVFDASASYDTDGEVISYTWDFGDGHLASGQVVSHTYAEADEYIISLAVTDNDGLTDSTRSVILIPYPTEKPDLLVDRVQVAQVLLTDDVPLVAGKPTLVRVYVDGATSVPFAGVRLYVQDIHGQQTYDGLLVGATDNPEPQNLDSTVNFYLISPPNSLSGSVTFRAEVDPYDIVEESNEGNNTSPDVEKTFQPGQQLSIAWTLIPYLDDGGTVTATVSEASQGHGFLRKIYPVGIDDVDYFFQPGFPGPVAAMFSCGPPPFPCPAKTEYIMALNRFWDRLTRQGGWVGGGPPDRLYGWVPVAASETLCGYADVRWSSYSGAVSLPRGKGRVAAGLDFPYVCNSTGAETLAHEIGHLLNDTGLRHAPCGGAAGPDPNYPYPDGSIGEWGVDLSGLPPRLLSPADTYDFMSYCEPWVSPYNYDKLHTGFIPAMDAVTEPNMLNAATRQLLVSGVIYTPSLKVDFDPFYAISSTVPADASSGGRFCLEQRDKGGVPLDSHCFELDFIGLESGNLLTEDAFALVVSHPVSATQIVLTHLGTPIHSLMVSENAPTVTLTYPNGGESWSGTGTYTVTWAANDVDGDPLFYALDYSPDAGDSWIPVGTDITSTHQVLDVSNLPGGSTVLLRVSASDRVNTADDCSDSTLTVGRKPPRAFILSPESNEMISPGTSLFLQGYAYDLEDGTLGEAALRWTSSLGGDLGTGHQLLVTLSPGQHVVTLTATDSDDNTATAAVTVAVVSIAKSVVPEGQVAYGDELTYTLVISATPGTSIRLFDPLESTTFERFVGPHPGITHVDALNGTLYRGGVITGTLEVTPTSQVTVSFAARVGVPSTVGWTADVTNRACVYLLDGTLGECAWSNKVKNPAFRPYEIYLPLVLRDH